MAILTANLRRILKFKRFFKGVQKFDKFAIFTRFIEIHDSIPVLSKLIDKTN